MGEIGGDDNEKRAADYTKNQNRLHSAYSFGLTGKILTKDLVINTIRSIEDNIEDGWMTYALGNHDNLRFASNHGQHEDVLEDYALYGMALLLTMRGSVCLFQGEELGLPTPEVAFEDMQDPFDIAMYPDSMNRDCGRTPVPWHKESHHGGFSTADKTWLPVYPEHIERAVDTQEDDEDSTLNHYRRFLAWRKENDILRLGDIEVIDSPDEIIVFKRIRDGQSIICIFNSENKDVEWSVPSDKACQFVAEHSHNIDVSDNNLTFFPLRLRFFY